MEQNGTFGLKIPPAPNLAKKISKKKG